MCNNTLLYLGEYEANRSTSSKHDCLPYLARRLPLVDVIESKLSPPVIVFTAFTNIMVCIVLTRKHMISPTNIILLGMAISDMLTGLFPLSIYFGYNFLRYEDYATHVGMNYAVFILVLAMPTILHTVSIWLTIILALQRFIYIRFPTYVATFCTNSHSVRYTIGTYVVSVLAHCHLFFTTRFRPYTVVCGGVVRGRIVLKCAIASDSVMIAYYWLRLILLHVIPCVSLIIFTILLIMAMGAADARRKGLLKQSKTSKAGARESKSTTMMLITVVVLFLIVEIPLGLLIVMYTLVQFGARYPWHPIVWGYMTTVLNFTILVSYPVNFFVYCTMSRQFRETFKSLFGCGQSTRQSQPAKSCSTYQAVRCDENGV